MTADSSSFFLNHLHEKTTQKPQHECETKIWQQLLLHALCCLSGHINATHGVKLCFCDVQMVVQAAAFTPLSDDGKVGLRHEAHEQQDVDVAGFPAEHTSGKNVRNSIRECSSLKGHAAV